MLKTALNWTAKIAGFTAVSMLSQRPGIVGTLVTYGPMATTLLGGPRLSGRFLTPIMSGMTWGSAIHAAGRAVQALDNSNILPASIDSRLGAIVPHLN